MSGTTMQTFLIAIGELFFFYIPAALIAVVPVMKWMYAPARKAFPFLMGALCALCIVCPVLSVLLEKHPVYGLVDVPFVLLLLLIYFLLIDLEKAKLIYLLICDMALMSFGGLIYHITAAVFNPQGTMQDSSGWGLLAQMTVNFLMILLVCAGVRKKLIWVLENFHNTVVWGVAAIIPVMVLFCNYMMVPRYYSTVRFRRIFQISIVLIITLFVLFATLQVMLYLIIRYLVEKYEMDRAAYALQMQAEQYEVLRRHLAETRRMRHDFRQTIYAIRELAERQDITHLKSYIGAFCDEYAGNAVTYTFCRNTALNALLAHYAARAKELQIDIGQWSIDVAEEERISDIDLCVIFGNILENAIAACERVAIEERYIQLSVDHEEDCCLYITMVNSSDGRNEKKNGVFISRKKEKSGIGLSSVQMVAGKYAGLAEFHEEGNEFYSNIMLQL